MTTSSDPEPGRLGRRELETRAVSGAMWTMINVAVSLPLAFVVNVIVARLLGVGGYGRVAYLTLIMEIAGVVVLAGVGDGLVQFGAKAHSRGDRSLVRSLLSRSQGFRLLIGAPVLTLLVLQLANVPVALLVLAILFGIWIPAGFGGAGAALTIQNDTAREARLAMLVGVVMQGAVLTAALILPKPDIVWATRMVVGGLGVIAALALVDRHYRLALLAPKFPTGMPKGFWTFALPIGASGVVSTIALNRSEVVLLEQLSTAEQVGLYAVAFGLAGHLMAPALALLNPLTPAVSALREVDLAAVQDAFRRTARIGGVLGGFAVAIGGPVLALLVPLLYGEAFGPAGDLVLALTVVSGFLVLTFPMQAFVTARLRGRSVLMVNLLSAVAAIVLALIAIPFFGAWGAVIAKVAVVVTRIVWLAARETESFMVGRLEFLGTFRATVVASVTAILVHVVAGLVDPSGTAQLLAVAVVAALVSCGIYALLLKAVRTGLSAGDSATLHRVLPVRLHRLLRITLKFVIR